MKQTKRIVIGMAGVISSVLGMLLLVPAMLKNQYFLASISGIMVVGGLILIAIALGD